MKGRQRKKTGGASWKKTQERYKKTGYRIERHKRENRKNPDYIDYIKRNKEQDK